MNIYDIANAAGVSIATVSRVLNNGVVGKKTYKKVVKVMEEMGYTPNAFARGLGLGTMNTVGVVVSNIYDLYFARAISVLEENLRKHGYDLILCCAGDEKERKKYFRLLLAKNVDAVILIGSRFAKKETAQDVAELAQKTPVIIIGGYIEAPGVHGVICEDKEAVCEAVKTMCSKGHKKFLYLYDTLSPSGQSKKRGFFEGLAECGIDADEKCAIKCPRDIDAAKAAIEKAFASGMEFTAVLTSEDELAVGALQYAAEHGIKVPDDLAVIGYNNSLLSRATNPPLSSIDNKVDVMSEMGVQLLVNIFEKRNTPGKISVSTELVERATT